MSVVRAGDASVASPKQKSFLDDEQDQDGHEERQNAERFGEGHTDEEVTGLLRGS